MSQFSAVLSILPNQKQQQRQKNNNKKTREIQSDYWLNKWVKAWN